MNLSCSSRSKSRNTTAIFFFN